MSHEWMRQNPVDILAYLPAFLAESRQFKSANDADSKEHETIRLDLQDLLDQCYVDTATWGLPIWEDLVGLPAPSADSYSLRRANVLTRLRSTYTVTLDFLTDVVNQYVAAGNASIEDIPSEYRVVITIPNGDVLSWKELETALRIWIPAHIGCSVHMPMGPYLFPLQVVGVPCSYRKYEIFPAGLENQTFTGSVKIYSMLNNYKKHVIMQPYTGGTLSSPARFGSVVTVHKSFSFSNEEE